MPSRFHGSDNEQILKLERSKSKAGATVNEIDGDILSLEGMKDSGETRDPWRFWQWILEILSRVGVLPLFCTIVGLVAILTTLFKTLLINAFVKGTLFLFSVVPVVKTARPWS